MGIPILTPPLESPEMAAAPGAPPAGTRLLYPKADGWFERDSTGVERRLGPGLDGYQHRRAAGAIYQLPTYPNANAVVATSHVLNQERAIPLVVRRVGGLPVSAVSVTVQTAVVNAAVRLGLRATDPVTGMPGDLLTEFTAAGALAAATVGTKSQAVAGGVFVIPEGLTWLIVKSDTAAATLGTIVANHPAIGRFAFDPTVQSAGVYTAPAGAAGALGAAAPAWSAAIAGTPVTGLTLA